MLLTGTFVRNLDEQQRLALPKPIRESLGDLTPAVLYLAPGTAGSIALYTEGVFAQLAAEMGRHSPAGQDVRAFSRLFYAQAQRVELDRQGRLRIPSELCSFVQANKEVVLLGVRDHLELWERSRWEAYLAAMQPHYDQIAERAWEHPPSTTGQPATNATPSNGQSARTVGDRHVPSTHSSTAGAEEVLVPLNVESSSSDTGRVRPSQPR